MKKVMMMTMLLLFLVWVPQLADGSFLVIPLGTKGGNDESSLSGFSFASDSNTSAWVNFDCGTLFDGLKKAKHELKAYLNNDLGLLPAFNFFQKNIVGFLISHAHLDHVHGLITNTPNLPKGKLLIGTNVTIENLKSSVFNWKAWPNFGNEGIAPALSILNYVRVEGTSSKSQTQPPPYSIPATPFKVQAFVLPHSYPYLSTAYLVTDVSTGGSLLFFGDVGPDSVENVTYVDNVWYRVAPLVDQNKLWGIFLECSFTNSVADASLFGHLNPKWFMSELSVLTNYLAPTTTYRPPVVILHIKLTGSATINPKRVIRQQLKAANAGGYPIIFPKQGTLLKFDSGRVSHM